VTVGFVSGKKPALRRTLSPATRQLLVIGDEDPARRVVVRSAMPEEAERVNEKTGLGFAALHAVGAGKSDFAALEILANLVGSSELPVGNSAFPVEDTGGWLR